MGKRYILIDGVKHYLKEEGDAGDTSPADAPPADGGDGEDTTPDTMPTDEENVEQKAKKLAKRVAAEVAAELGLDEVRKVGEKAQALLDRDSIANSKIKQLLHGKDLIKDRDQLTKEEIIVGFFHALVTRNEPAIKALSEGVAADGGNLFPDEFASELQRPLMEVGRMRAVVRVIPMRRDVMQVPTSATRPKVYWTAENAAKTTTTATFGQVTLTVRKAAAILYASDELIADSTEIDVVRTIIDMFAEAIGDEEDHVITAGNGTTQPTGFALNTPGHTFNCVGNLSFDNVIRLIYSLPQPYHANARFMVHRNNIAELRMLKDNNGRYLWNDPVAPGQPATIYGYPVQENNWLAESVLYFGDFKRAYWLGDRQEMTVKVTQDTETAFTRDQTAIRVVTRIAGNVVLNDALARIAAIP